MAANSVVRVTDLNFSSIKSSLRDYLSSQSEFNDYDFESSTLSMLLDIMAYNTYHTSFYTNMVGNEMFLDSAQLRNNIVSRAKMLGYTPRSFQGSEATLQLTVTAVDTPARITIAKDTAFTSTIDSKSYKFVVPQLTYIDDNNGVYSANVVVIQGEPLTHRFTVSTSSPIRYVIPNPKVDIRSLSVQVQESSANSTTSSYQVASDLSAVVANTKMFFVQENEDSQYELIFGDGVFGKALKNGNIVIASYRINEGTLTNGANNFTATGRVGGYSTFSISTSSAASGGANQESLTSIKYNAPRAFESQGRLVTKADYKTVILNENGDIQAVSVWGGEDNKPPIYGRIYVSMKPTDGNIAADQIKDRIKSSLITRNMLSIEPVFVDATFLYVVPTVNVRYNPNNTSESAAAIADKIATKIIAYETDSLTNFDSKFYLSKFTKSIDDADTSIVGTLADILYQKRFTPVTTAATAYNLAFNNAISNPHSGHLYAISTSSFTTGSKTAYYDDDGKGNIRSYFIQNNSRTYISTTAGTIDYATGLVQLDNQLITAYSGSEVKVNMVPLESNVFTVRNQLLLIADVVINVIDDNTGKVSATLKDINTSGQTAALLQSQTGSIIY